MTRRRDCCQDQFQNVCVLIDYIEDVNLCTTGLYGEPMLEGNDIVFRFSKRLGKNVS